MGTALLACYLLTLAPGVTFWDAGELIAAAHGLGIPHPPGTPLYVALGRGWVFATSPVMSAARAMNVLSAVCTALAGALTAWLIARETSARALAGWGAAVGALTAGVMATAWANATETEVYAAALLHVVILLACAVRAGERSGAEGRRWLTCAVYLIALAPAVHLSVLVGAPAAVVLAGRRRNGEWRPRSLGLLAGTSLAVAGVGRVSPWMVIAGASIILATSLPLRGTGARERSVTPRTAMVTLSLVALAASALLMLLVRARHDPALNQGDPSSLIALADVVARRQYAVPGAWPRQAPVWLQLANLAQYTDWQVALGWGRGIFTTPARVLATGAFLLLAVAGVRGLRRDAARLGDALLVLLVCGSIGVAAYLNMKAGASLGWGVLPDDVPHEARERDYFFVLGFWAWGCFAGYGALEIVRRRKWPAPLALAVLLLPLVGNWRVSDRSREPRASAAIHLATSLLESAPPGALLFTAGDNDSYPLWYAQQVEGRRRDVTLVTLSLLPAGWYQSELSRRTGLPAPPHRGIATAGSLSFATELARSARRAGRPVVASPAVTASERVALGGGWRLEGLVYRSTTSDDGPAETALVDSARTERWAREAPPFPSPAPGLVDDVAASMSGYLSCPLLRRRDTPHRDSLEVKCNLR